MRATILYIAMFSSSISTCVAQEDIDGAKPEERTPTFDPATTSSEEPTSAVPQESADAVAEEWKPRFLVTLQVKENGQGRTITRKAEEPYYESAYEDREIETFDDALNAKMTTERVAVREIAYRPVVVRLYEPGVVMLLCDEVSLTIAKSETSSYEFECPGRLRLRIGGLVFDAESGSQKNGEMQLTGVKITQGVTTATADNLTLPLPLPVWGLTTADHNLPASKLLPAPPTQSLLKKTFGPGTGAPSAIAYPAPDEAFSTPEVRQPRFFGVQGSVPTPATDPLPTIIR